MASDGIEPGAAAPAVPRPYAAHLLVVDDNLELLGFLEMLLSSQYRVTALSSPLQAALLGQTQRFDLLISDIRMPQLSGTQLFEALRGTHLNHDLPVVFISGQVDFNQVDGDRAPTPYYLRKPFEGSDLTTAVEQQLRTRPPRNYG